MRTSPSRQAVVTALLAMIVSGCAARYEGEIRSDLRSVAERLRDPSTEVAGELDGSLESYSKRALAESPALRAAFERWRAAVHRIPQARRLPEPLLTYGYFIQSVETRVGPQRHRLGLSQTFPWPTKLVAGADAASIAARAYQREFEAAALTLQRRVSEAYWRLWLIGRTKEVQQEQITVLEGLSATTLARIEVGSATLADVAQVELAISRGRDAVSGLEESERAAAAILRASIGARSGIPLPLRPRVLSAGAEPAEERRAMLEAARAHPRVEASRLRSESAEARIARARADRFPSFLAGVDWIETGAARQDDVPGSGTDPIIVTVGLRLPLWQGAYGGAEEEARAQAAECQALALQAELEAEAELDQALSALRDGSRRIALYRDTLIPQAEAAYASVVGAYQTGRSTVAAGLMAQGELLELELGLARGRADHAMAWAWLEQIVGRPVSERTEALP